MARDLLTIRCPEDIKAAIEERIVATGKAKTDVVLELLRAGMGMPSITTEISTTALDERITILLDNRTTALYEQVTTRVEEVIAPVEKVMETMNDALGESLA